MHLKFICWISANQTSANTHLLYYPTSFWINVFWRTISQLSKNHYSFLVNHISTHCWKNQWILLRKDLCWTLNCKQMFFLFCYVLFNKGLVACDENNPFFGMWLCYKNIDYVLGFSCYFRLYSILWLWMSHIVGYWMKIGLLCLLSTSLISLYWEKQ
jgi:hypothetical protein